MTPPLWKPVCYILNVINSVQLGSPPPWKLPKRNGSTSMKLHVNVHSRFLEIACCLGVGGWAKLADPAVGCFSAVQDTYYYWWIQPLRASLKSVILSKKQPDARGHAVDASYLKLQSDPNPSSETGGG